VKNSPYLDTLVPLAVALRSMLAETEAKIATAKPSRKSRPSAPRAGAARMADPGVDNAARDLLVKTRQMIR
jgi:hypothetical protein